MYCLVCGLDEWLPFDHRHNEDNLELIFKDDPDMKVINDVLDGCMNRSEGGVVVRDASMLLEKINSGISRIVGNGGLPNQGKSVRCVMCKIGQYSQIYVRGKNQNNAEHDQFIGDTYMEYFGLQISNRNSKTKFKIFKCSHCGHCQWFDISGVSMGDKVLAPWRE